MLYEVITVEEVAGDDCAADQIGFSVGVEAGRDTPPGRESLEAARGRGRALARACRPRSARQADARRSSRSGADSQLLRR